jgi:hypothetical protein
LRADLCSSAVAGRDPTWGENAPFPLGAEVPIIDKCSAQLSFLSD